jgi:small conductance mechanosensitive channel
MDLKQLTGQLTQLAIDVGGKLLGAILLWIAGRFLISAVKRFVVKAMTLRRVDATLVGYAESTAGAVLNVLLVLAIFGVFGVQTTTFAALLAAAGLAIGTAWGSLLQNFAAGAFLVFLKPFKRGDVVTIAGITGTVEQISFIAVTLTTADNVRAYVTNGKVFGDTIQNYSANEHRRVDRTVQLAAGADWKKAIELLRAKVLTIPNVATSPAPEIGIVDFTSLGPVLAVRPYCAHEAYAQVFFDTNAAIKEELGAAGFPHPEQAHQVRSVKDEAEKAA